MCSVLIQINTSATTFQKEEWKISSQPLSYALLISACSVLVVGIVSILEALVSSLRSEMRWFDVMFDEDGNPLSSVGIGSSSNSNKPFSSDKIHLGKISEGKITTNNDDENQTNSSNSKKKKKKKKKDTKSSFFRLNANEDSSTNNNSSNLSI